MKLRLLSNGGSHNDLSFILLDVESQSSKKLPDATVQPPCFTDEVTKIRRGEEMCPKSYIHHFTTVTIYQLMTPPIPQTTQTQNLECSPVNG